QINLAISNQRIPSQEGLIALANFFEPIKFKPLSYLTNKVLHFFLKKRMKKVVGFTLILEGIKSKIISKEVDFDTLVILLNWYKSSYKEIPTKELDGIIEATPSSLSAIAKYLEEIKSFRKIYNELYAITEDKVQKETVKRIRKEQNERLIERIQADEV
ncbi:MAG: biotin synthase-related radical SAM superfamily protein, partial [Bacteroidia bacterium]